MRVTKKLLAREIARRCIDPHAPPGHDSLALARKINAEEGWRFERRFLFGLVQFTTTAHMDDDALLAIHAYAQKHYAELI